MSLVQTSLFVGLRVLKLQVVPIVHISSMLQDSQLLKWTCRVDNLDSTSCSNNSSQPEGQIVIEKKMKISVKSPI